MKKIIICILSILLVLGLMEVSCIIQEVAIIIEEAPKNQTHITIKDLKDYIFYSYKKKRELLPEEIVFRKPAIGKDKTKKTILISGCSYAYGYLLDEKECIHTVLSEVTGRTVTNLGILSGGIREFLWFLSNKEELSKHINSDFNVEYIIFIYNENIKRKLFYDDGLNCPQMRVNKDKTITILPDKPIYHLFLYKLYQLIRYDLMTTKKRNEIMTLYFKTIHSHIKELFPNSHFVIIEYSNDPIPEIQSLEQDGIKVITLGREINIDLYNNRYKTHDHSHPGGKIWEKTAKMLKDKLQL